MLPGKAIDAAIISRTLCKADTLDEALWYSDGITLLPKTSFIIEKPKYAACIL